MTKNMTTLILACLCTASTFAQLPSLPTSSRVLNIPTLEVFTGDAEFYYSVQLQATEDFQNWSLIGASELSILTYDRDSWSHWEDFDGDCQNTRHELLIASSEAPISFTSASNCTVSTGQWHDPYTGDTYTIASDLDIDHVIPLKYAHDHGGAIWSEFVKRLFANDPENLLAVDDGQNQLKSANGPSEWMPPNGSYHCEYARKWSFLTAKYELDIESGDLQRIEEILQGC